MTFLLIASFPDSLIKFRGPLLRALLAKGLEVHVAAPDLSGAQDIRSELVAMGITLHEIGLKRTGTDPVADLGSLNAIRCSSKTRMTRRCSGSLICYRWIIPPAWTWLIIWWFRYPRIRRSF